MGSALHFPRLLPAVALVLALAALSGCDSPKAAEEHYQAALVLLENGDTEAGIEALDEALIAYPEHREARLRLGEELLDLGYDQPALVQFRFLVKDFPDDVTGLQMWAEAGLKLNRFELVDRLVAQLEVLAPDDPRTTALRNALEYRNAIIDNDENGKRNATLQAMVLEQEIPESRAVQDVIVSSLLLQGRNGSALEEMAKQQALYPKDRSLYERRLLINVSLGEREGTEEVLLQMLDAFPDDESVPNALVRLYSGSGDLDKAELFLRRRAADETVTTLARFNLVRFLSQNRSTAEAIALCETYIAEGSNTDLFRGLRATLLYEDGLVHEAVSEMEDLLSDSEPGPQTNRNRLALVHMLLKQGNRVGARSELERVLTDDPKLPDALITRAHLLIEQDRTDEAIRDLLRVLRNNPNNLSALDSLADANLRRGERERALVNIERAMQVSGYAPRQTVRYARTVEADGKLAIARDALMDALRLHPANTPLLWEYGRLGLENRDWAEAEDAERRLRAIGTAEAIRQADLLRSQLLQSQDKHDDALAFLKARAVEADGDDLSVQIEILRSYLVRGDKFEATSYANELFRQRPEDLNVRFLVAAVAAATGDTVTARQHYRDLIRDGQDFERLWIELARLEFASGNEARGTETLRNGLEVHPENAELIWLRAQSYLRLEDYEAAIADFETLYALDSSTQSVANNLAILLSKHRNDAESLERAYQMARRLRDSTVPEYSETYGWIAYLRGDYDDALVHLERAVEALPEVALVHLHLGMVYEAMERTDQAKISFRTALVLAGQDDVETRDSALEHLEKLSQ